MTTPLISLIVAMDRQRAIGRQGGMPWHLPDDLRHFRQHTLGKPVLMGRRTFQSIGRPLPGRRNLVLSRQAQEPLQGVEWVQSLDQALQLCQQAAAPELMVIGGGEVYALALPAASTLWLTEVDTEVAQADAWFPQWDARQWSEQWSERREADARNAFARHYRLLQRKPDVPHP